MTISFISCHKFDHDFVFKVTRIIENFGTFKGGTNGHLWVWKIFIMTEDTFLEELPYIQTWGKSSDRRTLRKCKKNVRNINVNCQTCCPINDLSF